MRDVAVELAESAGQELLRRRSGGLGTGRSVCAWPQHAGSYVPAVPHAHRVSREVCARSRAFAPQGSHVRLPVAHMVCNQSPPVTNADGSVTPSLMTFDEVDDY